MKYINQKINSEDKDKLYLLAPTMQGGGLERVLSEIAMYFNEKYDVRVFVYRDNGLRYPLPVSLIELAPHQLGIPKIGAVFTLIQSLIHYLKYVVQYRPSVSLSFGGNTDIINMIVCWVTNTPCITSCHWNITYNQGKPSIVKRVYTSFRNRLYSSVSKYLVAISDEIYNVVIEQYGLNKEKVVVIHNPINTKDIFKKKEESLGDDFFRTNLPIILSVGWLYHIKGQWHLIRVFSEIQKIIPCKLVLLGSGIPGGEDYTDKYKQLVSKLGLSEAVHFAGWQENPYKYMSRSTIFVHSSLSEASPNVICEALACGCPVVASDCDFGPRDILDNGKYGLLCACSEQEYLETEPLTDAEKDMMDKIVLLLTNQDLRSELIQKGLERSKEFDTKKSMEKYGELFQDCIKSKSKR